MTYLGSGPALRIRLVTIQERAGDKGKDDDGLDIELPVELRTRRAAGELARGSTFSTGPWV
ncbi:MAG: hypothetical protein ACYTFT_01970, partial [Planctomycetota bacterium]